MTTKWSPDCYDCKHLHPRRNWEPGSPRTCDAFPQGIPREIWFDGVEHREPYPDDHGIQFEPIATEGKPHSAPR